MKRTLILIPTVVILCLLLALPTLAAGIDGNQIYAVSLRTPVTFLNFSNGYNQFPVGDVISGFRSHPEGVAIDLYSAGYEEDYDPEYLNTIILPIATNTTGENSPVTQVRPVDVSSLWNPVIWDGRYYQLSGAGGRLTLDYYPEGYEHSTSSGNVIYYKCFTTSNFQATNYSITAYELNYTAPVYQSDGTILISPDYSINGNDPAYFEAMKNAGFYTLTLHCQSEANVNFDCYVQWLAYAGDYRYNMGGYITQTVNPEINAGASYDFGYTQGFTAGKNSMQSAINQAYENGFSAGTQASDGSGGIISSAILALGDIPFNMLFGVLDMEILGINLASLVSMAITGASLIFIIKTFMI